MTLVLVLGGTRSGKSAMAEGLVAGHEVAYLATGTATDPETTRRIAAHVARRPAAWTTHDVGNDPAAALADTERTVLLDGLGAWIAGELHRAGAFEDASRLDAVADRVREKIARFAADAVARPAPIVVVCEEASLAPVAADAATRRWVDLVGESAQALSAVAERVLLVVAGRALELPPGAPAPLTPSPGPVRPDHGDRLVPEGHEDFAVNVVAAGPPAWLTDALRDAPLGRYPDDRAATAAVAARHGRAAEECLLLNGAAEAFWLLAALRPRAPAVVVPSFTEPLTALRAHGTEPRQILREEAQDFALDPARVPPDADMVFVGNPCNPTGVLHLSTTLARLATGRVLVVDESFMDLVPGEPESLAGQSEAVVVRSLTKSLGVPGVRAGYLLGPAALLARLAALRQAWPLNALALAALHAWAGQDEPIAARAAAVARARERFTARLAGLPGVHVTPSAANFVLVRVPDGPAARARLAAHRIAVRPTVDLGLTEHHLRIAVRDPAAQDRLLAALSG